MGFSSGTVTKMAEIMANGMRGKADAGIVEIKRTPRFQHAQREGHPASSLTYPFDTPFIGTWRYNATLDQRSLATLAPALQVQV